jgi:FixJ family two-component response regulator
MADMPTRARIAIVDDEEPVRRALRRMLSTSLFSVDDFASGQEFLDSLLTRQPDCVLLDFQMPGLSGRDVCERMRQARIDVPVILMTAHEPQALRVPCIADGTCAYLHKPLQRDQLIKALEAATGAHPPAPAAETH